MTEKNKIEVYRKFIAQEEISIIEGGDKDYVGIFALLIYMGIIIAIIKIFDMRPLTKYSMYGALVCFAIALIIKFLSVEGGFLVAYFGCYAIVFLLMILTGIIMPHHENYLYTLPLLIGCSLITLVICFFRRLRLLNQGRVNEDAIGIVPLSGSGFALYLIFRNVVNDDNILLIVMLLLTFGTGIIESAIYADSFVRLYLVKKYGLQDAMVEKIIGGSED